MITKKVKQWDRMDGETLTFLASLVGAASSLT